jgi:hypothetical protein
MKKYTYIILLFTLSLSISAQNHNRAAKLIPYGEEDINLKKEKTSYSTTKLPKAPHDKAVNEIPIGTSSNVHSTIRDRQNQVVYNKDINTVAFGHRLNAGVISFDYSTDGGANWTINPFPTTPALDGGSGNNYPSIGIYNPAANTNPNNAFIVQTGTKATFDKSFRTSVKLDGTLLDETYMANSTIGPAVSNNEHGGYGLYVTSIGEAWYASSNWNTTTDVNLHLTGSYHDFFITKGVFNIGNNQYDWVTTDTITPSWYSTPAATGYYTNVATSPNMAWSIDGMTGYMVTMGADSNANNNSMWRPYVMKTIDGGVNWANFPDFDFSTDVVLQNYIWSLNTNPTEKRPFFGDFDIVVDNNDELRIFCQVHSGFSSDPDSLSYYFGAVQSRFLFEIATNSGLGSYDVNFIDSVYVDDHTWDVSASARQHLIRPQAARSQDGTKVFYTWLSSDLSISALREFPSINGIGHELATNKWTNVTNLSAGNNSQFLAGYPTMAVDVIENGLDKSWELPIVYITSIGGGALVNADSPGQYYFLKGIGFDQIDFQSVGIDEGNNSKGEISIYPNPTESTFTISLEDFSQSSSITVYDILGKTITTKQLIANKTIIDLTGSDKGVYFISVQTENGNSVRKVILQ